MPTSNSEARKRREEAEARSRAAHPSNRRAYDWATEPEEEEGR